MEIKKLTMYEDLNILENHSSTTAKIMHLKYMLERYSNFENYLRLVYNDAIYGVKEKTIWNAFDVPGEERHKWASVTDWLASEERTIDSGKKIPDLIEFCENLISTSGYQQEEYLRNFLTYNSSIKSKWFARAILHDLRAGVKVKTVNSVFKELGLKEIPVFGVQLAGKDLDIYSDVSVAKFLGKKIDVVGELKYDGYRIIADIFPDGKVILMSRRGNDKTDTYPEICAELAEYFEGQRITLDGEIVAKSFQSLTRLDDTSIRQYAIFDLIVDKDLRYLDRWYNLVNLLEDVGLIEFTEESDNQLYKYNIKTKSSAKTLFLAEHFSFYHLKDIQDYFVELNLRKEEGMIIKLPNAKWIPNDRKGMLKVKKVYTADLEVIDCKYGEGKRAGKVATLCLRDASKTINVDVGSGIDDDMSEYLTGEIKAVGLPSWYGKIVEILYNEKTETGSLRFPRFVRFRDDKDEPDDLSEGDN